MFIRKFNALINIFSRDFLWYRDTFLCEKIESSSQIIYERLEKNASMHLMLEGLIRIKINYQL